jgi:hypothetical protein
MTLDENKYGDSQQRCLYREAMERLGEDVVRMRLANRMPISDRPEDNPPPAFANIWLIQKAAARKKAESVKFWLGIFVGVVAAVAAIVAAAPVVRSWIWMIWIQRVSRATRRQRTAFTCARPSRSPAAACARRCSAISSADVDCWRINRRSANTSSSARRRTAIVWAS